jgi:hypothetical protein
MGPQFYLIVVLAAAIPATYGTMWVKREWAVSAAYKQGKIDGAGAVAAKTTEAATETVKAVEAGERSAEPAPADKTKLIELCNRSASCRDRKRGGV